MIAVFSGVAFSGKDLAVSFLADRNFVRVSFADPIRKSLLALNPYVPNWHEGRWNWDDFVPLEHLVENYGWDKAKQCIEVRRLLQRLGTEAGRDIHGEDCWVRIASRKIGRAIEQDGKSVAISDCRFVDEMHALKQLSNVYNVPLVSVRIERPGVGPVNSHVSDNISVKCDKTIVNDGDVEQFRKKVLEAVLG